MTYLEETFYLDYHSPEIKELVKEFDSADLSEKEKAIGLYLKVRDGWRYNPYYLSFKKESYKSSIIANKKDGHCLEKSILYISGLRALKIPARIHLAKVKNHIGVERLVEKIGTNELSPHGMVDVFLEGKWLKASPAFNKELCEKLNVAVLDFDGENDSMFQEFSSDGIQFMDYLEDYGSFDDVPTDFIFKNLKENYPLITEKYNGLDEIRI